MISRSEIDMLDIRECFRLRYEKSLYNMIKVGETLKKHNLLIDTMPVAWFCVCLNVSGWHLRWLQEDPA